MEWSLPLLDQPCRGSLESSSRLQAAGVPLTGDTCLGPSARQRRVFPRGAVDQCEICFYAKYNNKSPLRQRFSTPGQGARSAVTRAPYRKVCREPASISIILDHWQHMCFAPLGAGLSPSLLQGLH